MILLDTNIVSEVMKPSPSEAIARANGGAVATRSTRDFQECGLELIDPFVAA